MTKITARIPRQKFAYLEIEKEIEDITCEKKGGLTTEKTIDVENEINKMNDLITKHSLTDLEVIMTEKTCPKCHHNLMEKIDISEKTNKPYHKVRCSNIGECDFIQWIPVAFKKDFKIEEK